MECMKTLIIYNSTQYIPVWDNKCTFEHMDNEEVYVLVHIHYC